ncbi:Alpha/Beta hydrolase protein [Xylariaceae sp. FL0255]|nr:Alpha/Beta hydrolase protein [Xylariaceae sp. FL0255]
MAPLSRWAAAVCAVASSLAFVHADLTAGEYYVRNLPGAPKDDHIKMHAGHIEVDPGIDGNLFFWHFHNKHIANKQRTVIWLNGGPGCSSEDGALMEIGPYRLKDADNLVHNEGTWNEFANLLFVDNPVGTGFSYVDTNSYIHELDQMADHFITFLEKWFRLFPEYENDEIYIAGESYAGQHIPYIAKAILDRNKAFPTRTAWNLQGLLIGNGWISPTHQYEAYLTFAYEKGVVQKGSDIANKLEAQWISCKEELAAGDYKKIDVGICEQILNDMLRLTQKTGSNGEKQCVNMYDVRLTDTYPSCGMNWPPDLKYVTPYLRKQEVVAALHLNANKNTGWTECNGAVGNAFNTETSIPSVTLLPELLEHIKILLFSGSEDLICNHIGTENFISTMEWNGGKGMELTPGNFAPQREWTFDGEAAGFWQEARNLTYVLFNDSSHMVPFDYPLRSRDMFDRFSNTDISNSAGTPSSGLLDGEKLPTGGDSSSAPDQTTGGQTTSDQTQTSEDQAAKDKEINDAKWAAYQRSGEVVLTIVAIGAAIWGIIIWRSRKRTAGYTGLPLGSDGNSATALGNFRNGRRDNRDLEAADFDETQLHDLHSVGEDSEEEDDSVPEKGDKHK